MADLSSTVALVTGASRGAGRGIALELGRAGATVYVTGRSTDERPDPTGMPGTVLKSADAITQSGGKGIACICDHCDPAQVQAVAARIEQEQGRLDVLVSNAWGGYEGLSSDDDLAREAAFEDFTKPIHEQPPELWRSMFERGVRFHLESCRAFVPLVLKSESGLIVLTTAWDRDLYLGNSYYDVAKHAAARLATVLDAEYAEHGVTSIALACGWMRTERVLAANVPDLSRTESPEFDGKLVVALAADLERKQFSGKVIRAGDLAAHYEIDDDDGKRPPPFEIDAE